MVLDLGIFQAFPTNEKQQNHVQFSLDYYLYSFYQKRKNAVDVILISLFSSIFHKLVFFFFRKFRKQRLKVFEKEKKKVLLEHFEAYIESDQRIKKKKKEDERLFSSVSVSFSNLCKIPREKRLSKQWMLHVQLPKKWAFAFYHFDFDEKQKQSSKNDKKRCSIPFRFWSNLKRSGSTCAYINKILCQVMHIDGNFYLWFVFDIKTPSIAVEHNIWFRTFWR